MYTDNTLLTSGKYKFVRLCHVPSKYLLGIYQSNNQQDKELYSYISSNLDRIKTKKNVKEQIQKVTMLCNKITYCSEKEAKQTLHRIEKTKQEHKKPKRAYECAKCSGWHLTAIPYEKWYANQRPAGVLRIMKEIQPLSMMEEIETTDHVKVKHNSTIPEKTNCEKFSYKSEKEARINVQKIEKSVPEFRNPVRAYPCQKCGGWHLTSVPYEKWEVSFKRADILNQMQWLQAGGHYRFH